MAMTDDWGGESSTRLQESVRPRQREFEEVLVQLLLQGMKPLVRPLPVLRPRAAAVRTLSRRVAAGGALASVIPSTAPTRESGGRCSDLRRAHEYSMDGYHVVVYRM